MDASLISIAVDEYVSSEAKFVDQMHIVLGHVYKPALKDPDIPQDLLESVFSPMKSILSLHESLSQALSSLPEVEDISIRLYAFICTILAAFRAQLDPGTGLTTPDPDILSLYTSHWYTLSLPADQWPLHTSPSLASLTHGCVTTLQCLAPDLPLSLPSLESLLLLPALRMQGACLRVSSLLASLQAVLPAHHPDVEMLQSLRGVLERVAPLPQVVCVSGKRAEAVGACSRAKAWVCAEIENNDSGNGARDAGKTVNVYIDELGVDLWRYGPGLDLVCEGEVEVTGAQVRNTISGSISDKDEEEWMWGYGGRVWLFNSCFVVVSDDEDISLQLSPTTGQMGVGRDIVDVEGWCVVGAVADVKYSATVEYGIEVDVQIPIRKLNLRNNASPTLSETPESTFRACGYVRVLLGLGSGEEQEVWVRALLGVMRGQRESATRREREREREKEKEKQCGSVTHKEEQRVRVATREVVVGHEAEAGAGTALADDDGDGGVSVSVSVYADGVGTVAASGMGFGVVGMSVDTQHTLTDHADAHTHDSADGSGDGAGVGAGARVGTQQAESVDIVDVVGASGPVDVAVAEQDGDSDVGEAESEHTEEVGVKVVREEEKQCDVYEPLASTHAADHVETYPSQKNSLSEDVEITAAAVGLYRDGDGEAEGEKRSVEVAEEVVEEVEEKMVVEELEEVRGVLGPMGVWHEAGLQHGTLRDADAQHAVADTIADTVADTVAETEAAAVAWSVRPVMAEEEKEVDTSSAPNPPHAIPVAAADSVSTSAATSTFAYSSASASALGALPVPASTSVPAPLRALPHTMSLPHVQYTHTHAHPDAYAQAAGNDHVLPASTPAVVSSFHTAPALAFPPMAIPVDATVTAAASIPTVTTHTSSATDTATVSVTALPISPAASIPSTVLSHPLVRAAACRREAALSLARVCAEVVEGERRRAHEEEERVRQQVEHMREVLRSLSENKDVVGNAGTGAGHSMGMDVGVYGRDTYS